MVSDADVKRTSSPAAYESYKKAKDREKAQDILKKINPYKKISEGLGQTIEKVSGGRIKYTPTKPSSGGSGRSSSGSGSRRSSSGGSTTTTPTISPEEKRRQEQAAADKARAEQERARIEKQLQQPQTAGALLESIRREEELRRIQKEGSTYSERADAAVRLREEIFTRSQITGKPMTSSQARKFLGGSRGVKQLKAGTRAEREHFKETGVSMQQERRKARALAKERAEAPQPYFEKRLVDTERGIPIYETFYVDPFGQTTDPITGEPIPFERKATLKEAKEYGLGGFEPGELKILPKKDVAERITDLIAPVVEPVYAGLVEHDLVTGYQKTEERFSRALTANQKLREEMHKKYMRENPEDKQAKAIWKRYTAVKKEGVYGTSDLQRQFLDRPMATAATIGVGAAYVPTLTGAVTLFEEPTAKALKTTKKGVADVDVFGLPVGGVLSEFVPETGLGLIQEVALLKGAGKVISKAPKVVTKAIPRAMVGKGAYGLTFGETPEERAEGLVELGMGLGFQAAEYTGRRLRLQWDKNQVIKYSVEERAKFEAAKLKGQKYTMKPRPAAEQTQIKKQVAEARELWKYQPKVAELDLQGIDRISPQAREPLVNYLKRNKVNLVVGGTAGTRTQVINPATYKPHDIDIFTLRGKPENYAKNLVAALEKAGVKGYRVKGAGIIAPNGKEAIEFHRYDEFLKANIEQVAPFYRTSRAGLVKTPSGIKVLSMRSQIGQKTLGYARYGEARLKDFLYASKEAKPALLKAKAQKYKDDWGLIGDIPEAPLPTPTKRVPKKKVSYDTFDYAPKIEFAPQVKTRPVKTPKKAPYKGYAGLSDVYVPYAGLTAPYKPYKPTKRVSPGYRPTKYDPFAALAAPYKPTKYKPYQPVKKAPYRAVPKKKTPYKPYERVKQKPFTSLLADIDMPRRPQPKKKVVKKKVVKRKPRYEVRQTGFEAALGIGGRVVRAGSITGFEALRTTAPRRRPQQRKKVAKKTPQRKKDDWTRSLF